jgi:hypothetical protein
MRVCVRVCVYIYKPIYNVIQDILCIIQYIMNTMFNRQPNIQYVTYDLICVQETWNETQKVLFAMTCGGVGDFLEGSACIKELLPPIDRCAIYHTLPNIPFYGATFSSGTRLPLISTRFLQHFHQAPPASLHSSAPSESVRASRSPLQVQPASAPANFSLLFP